MLEVTQVSRLVAARPGSNSGVFLARPEAARFLTFAEGQKAGAIKPISNATWSQFRSLVQGGRESVFRESWPNVPSGSAIVPLFSEDMVIAAQINSALGLVDESYISAVKISSNKLEFYKRLAALNPNFPAFTEVVEDTQSVRSTFLDLGVEKIVVKPTKGSGSEGVFLTDLQEPSALDMALSQARSAASPHASFLAMQFLEPGDFPSEIALNFVVRDGYVRFLEMHAKVVQSTEPPFRDRLIASYSPNPGEMKAFTSISTWITEALGLRAGIVQSEIRIDPSGQMFPIDVAVRPDGGLVPDSIIAMRGLDIRMAHVLVQLGALEQLDDLLRRTLDVRVCETALGAFYGEELSSDIAARIWQLFHHKAEAPSSLVSGMYGIEGSLMPLASTELRFGLCTSGETVEKAVDELGRMANELGASG